MSERVFQPYWKRNASITVTKDFDHQIRTTGYNCTTGCEFIMSPSPRKTVESSEVDGKQGSVDPTDSFGFEICFRRSKFADKITLIVFDLNQTKMEFPLDTQDDLVGKISVKKNMEKFDVVIIVETVLQPDIFQNFREKEYGKIRCCNYC